MGKTWYLLVNWKEKQWNFMEKFLFVWCFWNLGGCEFFSVGGALRIFRMRFSTLGSFTNLYITMDLFLIALMLVSNVIMQNQYSGWFQKSYLWKEVEGYAEKWKANGGSWMCIIVKGFRLNGNVTSTNASDWSITCGPRKWRHSNFLFLFWIGAAL